MKTWLLILSLLFVGCVSAPEKPSISFSSDLRSKYEFFNGVIAHDDPVLQTDVTATYTNGFQLGVWWSTGLNDFDSSSDFADELDYTVGWKGKLDTSDVSIGVSYFDLLEIGKRTEGAVDVLRPYLTVAQSYEVTDHQTLGPIAKLEGRMRVAGDTNPGATLWLGAQHGWSIRPCFNFTEKLRVVADTGSIGFEEILLGRYDASFTHRFTKNIVWNILSFTVTTPLSSAENGQETSETYGTGITISK